MTAALEKHEPRNNEYVVSEGMAELMPPIFTQDFVGVDFVDRPMMRVPGFVEEDSLEDVTLEWNMFRKLTYTTTGID